MKQNDFNLDFVFLGSCFERISMQTLNLKCTPCDCKASDEVDYLFYDIGQVHMQLTGLTSSIWFIIEK